MSEILIISEHKKMFYIFCAENSSERIFLHPKIQNKYSRIFVSAKRDKFRVTDKENNKTKLAIDKIR